MKLNDPFGRVGRRHSQGYADFRRQLQERGLRDAEALAGLAASMRRSAFAWAALTLLSGTLAMLLFPAMSAIIGVGVILALLWLGSSWWQARMHLRRYRIEEHPDTTRNREGGDP